MIKLEWIRSYFLWMSKESCFLMERTLHEIAVHIVEMTTKDAEYYINITDKVVVGFWGTDS